MLRALVLLAAFGVAAAPAMLHRWSPIEAELGWTLLGVALVLAAAASRGLVLPGTAIDAPLEPPAPQRRRRGVLLAVAGAILWALGPVGLLRHWPTWFDAAWAAWLLGTALLAAGLDLAWARWRWPAAPRRRLAALLVVLVALSALHRFGTFVFFPGESHITQIEELQVGAMGTAYLAGWRQRWEYLSHAWLAALGIGIGGPSLFAMRTPFIVVSILKTIPVFLWLRFAVGNAGAVAGTALMVVSAWDVTYARSPTNQNAIVEAVMLALLAGPARRGRPSAYVWLGLIGGYVLYEYVGYRLVGLFAVAGGIAASLRRGADPLWARLARPALTVALIAVMGGTLYTHLARSGQMYQYFDGWGRARANQTHYKEDDSLGVRLERVRERALRSVSLFYFYGDESPTRNLAARPMVDPLTGALLVLGLGYGLANPLRSLGGLTVAALLLTLAGSLVATGNFDPVRAGSAVPFVYGLAGYGAAALVQAMTAAWGRWGRRLAAGLLAAGVLAAWTNEARFLREFVESPRIRQNQFRDIAYLSAWIGRHARPGETVIAIAPGTTNVLEGNDGAWVRGQASGKATWDVAGALAVLQEREGPILFLVAAGVGTPGVVEYLGGVVPEFEFTIEPGPLGPATAVAFARLPSPPVDLATRLAGVAGCGPVKAEFEILGADGEVLARHDAVLPFIDRATFPQAFMADVWRLQAQAEDIRAQFNATFEIETPGTHGFVVELLPGRGDLFVDGEFVGRVGEGQLISRALEAGAHRLELRLEFQPRVAAPWARLSWVAPETDGRREIMPLHRLGADPECARE